MVPYYTDTEAETRYKAATPPEGSISGKLGTAADGRWAILDEQGVTVHHLHDGDRMWVYDHQGMFLWLGAISLSKKTASVTLAPQSWERFLDACYPACINPSKTAP